MFIHIQIPSNPPNVYTFPNQQRPNFAEVNECLKQQGPDAQVIPLLNSSHKSTGDAVITGPRAEAVRKLCTTSLAINDLLGSLKDNFGDDDAILKTIEKLGDKVRNAVYRRLIK